MPRTAVNGLVCIGLEGKGSVHEVHDHPRTPLCLKGTEGKNNLITPWRSGWSTCGSAAHAHLLLVYEHEPTPLHAKS